MTENAQKDDLAPVRAMLGVSAGASVGDVLDAIRRLQGESHAFRRSAENWASAYHSENRGHRATKKTLNQVSDPFNWVAVFTGEEGMTDPDDTVLVHGNLVTIDGTGQFLLYYRPSAGKRNDK